jgi:SAM-dependent methyltransferase
MTNFSGVAKIMRFNWPWYALALVATIIGTGVLWWWIPAGFWRGAGITAIVLGDSWFILSLAVSHYVYDRSTIARGGWLGSESADSIVILHAGHDEASVHVTRLLPTATCRVFDIFDVARCSSPSLLRARAEAQHTADSVPLDQLPLADASIDLVLAIFAAHEIRDHAARTACFRELARITNPNGRIVVVEHLRDAWNLLAYGPGFLHFLSRRTWLRTFADAKLTLIRDDTMTPWVHRFEVRKSP